MFPPQNGPFWGRLSFSCPVCKQEASYCCCAREDEEVVENPCGAYLAANDLCHEVDTFQRVKKVASKDVHKRRPLRQRKESAFDRINRILTKKEKAEQGLFVPEMSGVAAKEIKQEIQNTIPVL